MTFSDSGKFVCNVCGTECDRPPDGFAREKESCPKCNSTVRLRALIALFSEELLGAPLALPDLPVLKSVRGIGMSDDACFAEPLAARFDYTNTFYHQAPRFDVTQPEASDFGRYDFVLSSEVLEHVPPPIERAFENLWRVLKPDGLLFLTTPFGFDPATTEHFPELHEYALASPGGHTVLVNRRRDGVVEVFENLVFHGGAGSTVEMRFFSENALREMLLKAGFSSVRICFETWPEFGVERDPIEKWSLPIVARKGTFRAPIKEIAVAYRDALHGAGLYRKQLDTLQADYERHVEYHNRREQELKRELEERAQWALGIERKSIGVWRNWEALEKDLTVMQAALANERAALATLESSRWTRLGRKLRLLGRR